MRFDWTLLVLRLECYGCKVHGANMVPIWGRQDPGGPHVGPMNFAIWVMTVNVLDPSQWRHNDHDGVWNHQPHGCLLNRLFRRRSKKTSKLRVTGLCVGNSPGPVNSPHKWSVTRKMFPFGDVIMPCVARSSVTVELILCNSRDSFFHQDILLTCHISMSWSDSKGSPKQFST